VTRTLRAEKGITNVVVSANHLLFFWELHIGILITVEINRSELVSITPENDE